MLPAEFALADGPAVIANRPHALVLCVPSQGYDGFEKDPELARRLQLCDVRIHHHAFAS